MITGHEIWGMMGGPYAGMWSGMSQWAGPMMFAFAAFMIIFWIAVWVYMAFAFTAIAKKLKYKYPGIAWIPFVGPLIIAFQASKMHWWPWLLLIGYVVPVIGWIATVTFWVFSIIWMWKMFERIKRPGWWAILMIVPIVGLVMIGVAAWGKK
ncbi:MAG: hypothetical protein KGH55_02050 [Nanoarchaeota archaeon]|nr:hypothetical protein [Nanoarchaeota archaeon]